MKIPPSPDRETFQQLLANASATQESQISAESLSAAMDLHLDGAMRYIVEATQKVADAAGVGIALLKRDRLTYRAGIGSCANCVGLQVAASLTVCAGAKTNREILRVENAQTDTRIEADICRQFGANALLILPIYREGAVAGVFDVRFNGAHSFEDHEIQTYRSMAEQVEVALSRVAQLEHEPERPQAVEAALAAAADAASIPNVPVQVATPELEEIASPLLELEEDASQEFEEGAPLDEDYVDAPAFMMLPQNEHSLYARFAAVLADIRQMAIFRQTAWLSASVAQRAKKLASPSPRASTTVAASRAHTFRPPTLPAALLAQRARIATWPERGRRSAQAAVTKLSLMLKRTATSTTILGERAKHVIQHMLSIAQAAAQELSTSLRKSAFHDVVRVRQARTNGLSNRWRNSAKSAATEVSSVLKRTASSAARLPHRAQNLAVPNRWQNFAQAMAAEFAAILGRARSSATRLTQRAQNFTLPSGWRNAAVTTVAVVLAFVAGIVYKSHSPARSLESSTLPSASPADHPTSLPKPDAAKPAAAVKPVPVPMKSATSARNTSKRVRVNSNEVDYIGDDVTVRTFTYDTPTKRTRAAAGRTAQYGDDVTVRYFTPTPAATKTAVR